jgi:hypothetical protein
LEVHPPDHALHSWRDFFIHMGTITLGLLIAIGLEQTVEALHHRHQHRELVESLHQDSERINEEATRADGILTARIAWLYNRTEQVQTALDQHRPLPAPAPNPVISYYWPTDPAWTAARSSGLLALFSQQDVKAYSELEDTVHNIQVAYHPYDEARRARVAFERSFTRGNDPATSTLATASPEDLHRYLDILRSEATALARLLSWVHQTIGANAAIQHGERDLTRIYAEEDRFDIAN